MQYGTMQSRMINFTEWHSYESRRLSGREACVVKQLYHERCCMEVREGTSFFFVVIISGIISTQLNVKCIFCLQLLQIFGRGLFIAGFAQFEILHVLLEECLFFFGYFISLFNNYCFNVKPLPLYLCLVFFLFLINNHLIFNMLQNHPFICNFHCNLHGYRMIIQSYITQMQNFEQ